MAYDLDVVLSLFDGISCGQEALKRAGLTNRIFLASEVEKAPKLITRKNHPLTVQLGDVRDVKGENLPKVGLIFAGSPCQDVSFATGKGKGLVKGERSNLFFEFIRILEECRKFNPDVKFLLENVRMKQEYQTIISEHLGVEPVMICSSLVSAQSRKRLYWTNIPGVTQPKDKGILLKDVLEDIDRGKPCELKEFKKGSKCHHAATATDVSGHDINKRVYADTGKSPTLHTRAGETKVLQKDDDVVDGPTYRKLSVLECSRLQTLPDSYLEGCFDDKGKEISNSQKFKALGNGWTCDVIVHLLQGLKKDRGLVVIKKKNEKGCTWFYFTFQEAAA
jgi:DNA (cytosine-5)-methyltransferase 3A